MQKWEKFLLICLFILAIIGCFIGFILAESGLGEVKILADIDLSNLLAFIILAVVVACAIFDTYETLQSKTQLGSNKFEVTINGENKFRNALIFFALVTIFEFGVLLYSIDIQILPLFFISLILTYLFVMHNKINNGIGENGILYWGIYHNWSDIKSHNIENEGLLEINIVNSFFGFEYNYMIQFNLEENDKQEIENFLIEKLSIIDNQLN